MVQGRIRPIDRSSSAEIELVARRMRQTLVEVLGEEVGGSMYTMDWLIARAKFHIDQEQCEGEIFLAEDPALGIVGHSIVRVEPGFGLFSTTYVVGEARRMGYARALVHEGEAWMLARNLPRAETYTDEANWPLIRLFEALSYEVIERREGFAILTKDLLGP